MKENERWELTTDTMHGVSIRRVIRTVGPKPRTVCIVEEWTREEDAVCLAAAPALLAALKALLRHEPHRLNPDATPEDYRDFERAREAITGATAK